MYKHILLSMLSMLLISSEMQSAAQRPKYFSSDERFREFLWKTFTDYSLMLGIDNPVDAAIIPDETICNLAYRADVAQLLLCRQKILIT